jgi:hypothetical protein
VHWNTIFTIIIAALAIVGAYLGARHAATIAINGAAAARDHDATLEHRRWLRERREQIYLDTTTYISWRRQRRDEMITALLAGTTVTPNNSPLTESTHRLAARLNLYGTTAIGDALERSQQADQRTMAEARLLEETIQRMKTGTEPTRPMAGERAEVARLRDVANAADDALVRQMVGEVNQPVFQPRTPLSAAEHERLQA